MENSRIAKIWDKGQCHKNWNEDVRSLMTNIDFIDDYDNCTTIYLKAAEIILGNTRSLQLNQNYENIVNSNV